MKKSMYWIGRSSPRMGLLRDFQATQSLRGAFPALVVLMGGLLAAYPVDSPAGVYCSTTFKTANVSVTGPDGSVITVPSYIPETICERTYDGGVRGGRDWGRGRGNEGGGGREQQGNKGDTNDQEDQAGEDGPCRGNPIVISTGNKIELEHDFASLGQMPLFLDRTWNQLWDGIGLFGYHWISNFDYRLSFGSKSAFGGCYARPSIAACTTAATHNEIWAHRPDGRMVKFIKNATDGVYYEDKADPISRIVRQDDGSWLLTFEDNLIELYTSGGYPNWIQDEHGLRWTFTHGGLNGTQLQKVAHTNGRYVEFTWVGDELRTVKDPASTSYQFSYVNQKVADGFHNIGSVILPGLPSTTISYIYSSADGSPGFSYLAGKSFNGERYSWFSYSGKYATSTSHANDVEKYSFVYTPGVNGELTVQETSPLGKQTTYEFLNGKPLGTTGHPSAHCPSLMTSDTTYDSYGYPDKVTDYKGNVTDFNYDAKGHLLTKTEALGASEARVTTYEWDITKNRVTGFTVANASGVAQYRERYTFHPDGRIHTIEETNLSPVVPQSQNQSRLTTYTYTKHPNGLLATATTDGPLPGDTVTSTYNTSGDLIEVKNSLGHATTYSSYNTLGQPGRITGPNGDFTEFTYDARGRVTTVRPIVGGVAQPTTYAYDGAGRLSSVETPDGRVHTREYDPAWRVTREYEPEIGGTYAVVRYTYNNASQVTSVETVRTTALVKPSGTPSLSITTTAPGNYNLSWSGSTGVENFVLEEKVNSGNWASSDLGLSTSKAYSGKAAGTYTYRVKACNAEGCTAYSSEQGVQVAYPPASAPVLTAPAADSDGAFTVSWTSVAGATGYSLWQRKDGSGLDPWQLIYGGTSLSKAMTGLANGRYEYWVEACNAVGCGSDSAVKTTVVTYPPGSAPTVTAPSASNNGALTISWTSVSTTTEYRLEQRKDAGSWSQIYSGTGLSKAVSGLTNGTYDYQARACNAGGCSSYSAIKTTVVTFSPIGVPTLTVPATNNNGAFTVSWTGVSAATRYELQRRMNGGSWSTLYNSSGLAKAESGLANGTYEYQVRACNVGGCAAFSSLKGAVVTHPPGAPAVTAPSASNNGAFTVSWGSVSTTTQYQLEQRKDAGSWSQIYSGIGLSKAVSGLTNGAYGYRARACNAGGCGSYSAIKTTVVTFPPSSAPSLSAPTSADTYQSFTVSWTAVSTATSYELQGNGNGGTWTTSYNGSALYVSRSHNYDGDYSYRVRACNVGGCGPFSAVRTVFVVDVAGGGPCNEGVCPEPK